MKKITDSKRLFSLGLAKTGRHSGRYLTQSIITAITLTFRKPWERMPKSCSLISYPPG